MPADPSRPSDQDPSHPDRSDQGPSGRPDPAEDAEDVEDGVAPLDPGREADVRRLLGEARHVDPIPAEVAERIDRALARLGVEDQAAEEPWEEDDPTGGDATGAVVPLARTRRRRATALLVAAAAIVVAGVGLGQVLRPAPETDSSSAASRARAQDGGVDRSGDASASAGSAAAEPTRPRGLAGADRGSALLLAEDPPSVSEARLTRGVRSVRRALDRADSTTRSRAAPGGFDCPPARWGPGRTVAVLADGAPAVLVLRPPTNETQVVDLLQCGTGDVLRSVTLPR